MIFEVAFFDVVILIFGRNQDLLQFRDKFLCKKRFLSIKKIAGMKVTFGDFFSQKKTVHPS